MPGQAILTFKRDVPSDVEDKLDYAILNADNGSSDTDVFRYDEPNEGATPRDSADDEVSDADIQRLKSNLKNASNKKGPKLLSTAEHAALQVISNKPTTSTKEQTKKRPAAPSATEQIQRKRLHSAVKSTRAERLAKVLPGPKSSNRTSLGIKIRLDRMRADVAGMQPGLDGGDKEEVLNAIQALIEVAEGAAERFRP
ncbi:MAG: hypothetical protein M1836_004585 [Candelina mexicana]|nr:MAG: hypothetical protein M1836_004585 [Candelina mexicana]